MLTKEEIKTLLELLATNVVVAPSEDFQFTISKAAPGYSKDQKKAALQAKLSIMLEMAK